MFIIDQYAYTNRLKNIHPGEKIVFSLITMCIAIASKAVPIHFIIMMIMIALTLWVARIPYKAYMGLIMLPVTFIVLGILPILINVTANELEFVHSVKMFNLSWGMTNQGINDSLLIFSRSMAAAMSLYFMTLTTPLIDVMEMLQRLKLPKILIEIMTLIYRFIFVLIDASVVIYHAQSARLGYVDIKTSFQSLGKLVSMMFIKAFHNSQALFVSLISRGYSGELRVLSNEYKLSKTNITFIVVVEICLILLSIMLGGR